MRVLLDTHLAIWWLTRSERFSTPTRELIQDKADIAFISRASLWEMAVKISVGKLRLDLRRFVQMAEATGFAWLDIRNEHILEVLDLPLFDDHKDPFDRLLVAQSLVEPLILLSADKSLSRYGPTIRQV